MYVKQLYTNCLAQAAYYVESDGEALVIDPLRDPTPYLQLAKERNAKIRYIFETHFHADFVSGHIDLSKKTGAVIVFGPGAKPKYEALTAFDGEKFSIGKIKIKVLHTPGHTLESSCFLLYDENNKPQCIFTGDTLFAGDVGRPDLLSGNMDKVKLAGMLYDSLNKKIKTLPDDVVVYPGHGPGSACGKNISSETVSTIGEQKRKNYALQCNTKDEFISVVTFGLDVAPAYFFKDALININGYGNYEELMRRYLISLTPQAFLQKINEGATILDTRHPDVFEKGFIKNSINIGLNGDLAVWTGTLIEFNSPLVLITEVDAERETVSRLMRIGYDNILGFLRGGIKAWNDTSLIETISSVDYLEFSNSHDNFVLLDVRNTSEYNQLKFNNSINIPLNILASRLQQLDKNKTILVCCAGGYRSMIAASILKKSGFTKVLNVKGGVNAYKEKLLQRQAG